jgi:protein-S-isoprenylcysteine O-methyltransferase Ste14
MDDCFSSRFGANPQIKTNDNKPSGIAMTKTIAASIWFIGIVAWYVIRRPFERKARRIGVSRSLSDRRERVLLAIAAAGLFLIPATYIMTGFPSSLDRLFIPALAWPGAFILGGALWLFRRSHVDLGRNWSVTLKLREKHALITTGVYGVVRHPMYSSFFLLGLAQLFLLPNWLAGTSGLCGALILFSFRVSREERMMLEAFGDDYREYIGRTKRIIPWIV